MDETSDDDEDATATTRSSASERDVSFPTVMAISLSCGALIALIVGLFVVRRRRSQQRASMSPSDSMEKPLHPLGSRGSFWTSSRSQEITSRRDQPHVSALTERSMATVPPELRFTGNLASIPDSGGAAALATPIRASELASQKDGISGLGSPIELATIAGGFVMSKSLQSLTGVVGCSFNDPGGNSVEDRGTARKKLRAKLEALLEGENRSVAVNDMEYKCFGALDETQYSFIVKCRPANDASTRLWLKIFVEHDAIYASKELRVLQLLQRDNTCMAFVPQLVDSQMHKKLRGIKCSVLITEMGTSTSFLHVARGTVDKGSQFSVVYPLSRVAHALQYLHTHRFIHGGLNMETIVVYGDDALKFRDLEHATPFKGEVSSYSLASLEFVPPEMARSVLCSGLFDGMEGSISAEPLAASYAFDIWSLGVLILKMYASGKHLDEFSGCDKPTDMLVRLAQPGFHFERSIGLYVPHHDVKDLVRQCLQSEPSFRPRIDAVLRHPVFQAYGHELTLRRTHSTPACGLTVRSAKVEESSPPSLWLFLPPEEIGLDRCLSVDDWVVRMEQLLQMRKPGDPELLFPLLFLCETTSGLQRACHSVGVYKSHVSAPLSLLSLIVPLVQETTVLLEARAALSGLPIADVSGLGKRHWAELTSFYRALEKMLLAPVSSFTQMALSPLQELLADGGRANAQQVLDEVACIAFSVEKREHTKSLLEIVVATGSSDRVDGMSGADWAALRKCEVESDTPSAAIDTARWLCRDHVP